MQETRERNLIRDSWEVKDEVGFFTENKVEISRFLSDPAGNFLDVYPEEVGP